MDEAETTGPKGQDRKDRTEKQIPRRPKCGLCRDDNWAWKWNVGGEDSKQSAVARRNRGTRSIRTRACASRRDPVTARSRARAFASRRNPVTRRSRARAFASRRNPVTGRSRARAFASRRNPVTGRSRARAFASRVSSRTRPRRFQSGTSVRDLLLLFFCFCVLAPRRGEERFFGDSWALLGGSPQNDNASRRAARQLGMRRTGLMVLPVSESSKAWAIWSNA